MKKKLFVIISTIVILCVGSVSFAATSLKDVKNTKYEDSVDTLITLGLVNGYEDDTYKPNNTITRAEMAKLMVVALGQDGKVSEASKKQSKFKDMKGNWAYGYVNVASDLGVINGYPDGTFGPQNNVSYAEATAMIIRALEYDSEVKKSKEVWPSNYINYANKLSLYSSVGAVKADDGAKRGNVAIMLWNMLRTGMCTVVGQNNNGLVYGQGEKMINKKMSKFLYMDDATITDIEFDSSYKNATIKIKGTTTITITIDADEFAEMYGQKLNVLYNTSTKKMAKIESASKNTVKTGEIEDVTSSKIYITGGSKKGYELPSKKNILLYGIDSLDDATSAILIFDGSTLKYVMAFPPKNVNFALVTETEVTVSKKDGIRIANYGASSSKAYALADEDDMPDEDDLIVYYLNSNSEIVILEKVSEDDAKNVTAASKTRITVSGKGKINSSDSYKIARIKKSTLKEYDFTDIEEGDAVSIIEFSGTKYIVVYPGAGTGSSDDDDDVSSKELRAMQKKLTSMISDAENILETKYTQKSYANLMSALTTAKSVKASSTKWKKYSTVKNAYEDLKYAYDSLVGAKNTTEKNTVAAKAALRKLVNSKEVTDAVKNKSLYVTSTYNTFNSALTYANKLLTSTSARKEDLSKAKGDLESALKNLVKTTTSVEKTKAITALNTALSNASKVGAKENYTETSYELFKAMWDEAKAINTTTAITEQIEQATKNLNNAIAGLEGNSEKEYAELLILLKDAAKITNDDYFDAEYTKFETARNNADKLTETSKATDIKTARENLKKAIDDMNKNKISDALAKAKTSANDYDRASDVKTALALKEDTREKKIEKINAINEAVKNEKNAVEENKNLLSSGIAWAKNLVKKVDDYTEAGINALKEAISKAEATLKTTKVTAEELDDAVKELNAALTAFEETKKPTTPSGEDAN